MKVAKWRWLRSVLRQKIACLPSLLHVHLSRTRDRAKSPILTTLKQLARQVVECNARTLRAQIQRSQLPAAPARNLGALQADSEIFCLFDQRVRDFNHHAAMSIVLARSSPAKHPPVASAAQAPDPNWWPASR